MKAGANCSLHKLKAARFLEPALRLPVLLLLLTMATPALRAANSQVTMDLLPEVLDHGPLSERFQKEVTPRLNVPDAIARTYLVQIEAALVTAHAEITAPAFILMVDRNVHVQAAVLFWGAPESGWRLIGAAPVSTGLPGRHEHFLTPLGAFEHTRDNPDFRATGSKNANGIRGYGRKGSRVYDFGWIASERGWGDHSQGRLRLQMHSTDADVLAQRLGTPQSEGCVRIPALINEFIDRYGILDADYDRAVATGSHFWLLRADRAPTPWSGRYLVVVDSANTMRPAWSPLQLTTRKQRLSINPQIDPARIGQPEPL